MSNGGTSTVFSRTLRQLLLRSFKTLSPRDTSKSSHLLPDQLLQSHKVRSHRRLHQPPDRATSSEFGHEPWIWVKSPAKTDFDIKRSAVCHVTHKISNTFIRILGLACTWPVQPPYVRSRRLKFRRTLSIPREVPMLQLRCPSSFSLYSSQLPS